MENVETEATNLGWVPKEQFRGDESKWVDAETFVERGHSIMPILKKNNERLQGDLTGVKGELAQVRQLFEASQEAIAELKKFHNEDTVRQVERAKKELVAQLKAAKADGNTDLEVDIQEQLTDLKEAQREVPAPERREAIVPPQPANDPEFQSWAAANPWFGKDRKRTALTVAAAEELRGAGSPLRGTAFFEAAREDADATLGGPRPASKVESGTPTGRAGGEKKRGFSDLPSDAKEVCDRQATRLVGPGRAFKTKAEWQAHYVEQYFQGE